VTLRELADAMEEVADYLDAGNGFDRAWANHLRIDAKAMRMLATAYRHRIPDEVAT
jgi:hypothetical protein